MLTDERALLASIPVAWRERAACGCVQSGFRAGPALCAGLDHDFTDPVPLAEAVAWVARYQNVASKAHIRLSDNTVFWFSPIDGFTKAEERPMVPGPGFLIRHPPTKHTRERAGDPDTS